MIDHKAGERSYSAGRINRSSVRSPFSRARPLFWRMNNGLAYRVEFGLQKGFFNGVEVRKIGGTHRV